jgi:hypothetical protein
MIYKIFGLAQHKSEITLLSLTAAGTISDLKFAWNSNPATITMDNFLITDPTQTGPTVNTVSNQTLCQNTPTNAVTFTGAGTSYFWTNDNTSIGLAAEGVGNIPSFTAIKRRKHPASGDYYLKLQTGHVRVLQKTFTITVDPPITQPVILPQVQPWFARARAMWHTLYLMLLM